MTGVLSSVSTASLLLCMFNMYKSPSCETKLGLSYASPIHCHLDTKGKKASINYIGHKPIISSIRCNGGIRKMIYFCISLSPAECFAHNGPLMNVFLIHN